MAAGPSGSGVPPFHDIRARYGGNAEINSAATIDLSAPNRDSTGFDDNTAGQVLRTDRLRYKPK